jgi:hypothetical protein
MTLGKKWGSLNHAIFAARALPPLAMGSHTCGNPYGYAAITARTQRAERLLTLQSRLADQMQALARAHRLRRNKSASLIEAEIKTTRNAIFREGPPE